MKKLASILVGVIIVGVVSYFFYMNRERRRSFSLQELRVGFAGGLEFVTLDPAVAVSNESINVVYNVYDRLVELNEKGQIVPMIAYHWEGSENFKKWTFWIRKGVPVVYYSNGEVKKREKPLTPEDVAFSLSRALKQPSYGRVLLADLLEGAEDFLEGKTDKPSGIVVDNENGTVTLMLKEPFAFLPQRLLTTFYSIVGAYPVVDYSTQSVTSGPYVIASWDKVRGIVELVKNPFYWQNNNEAPSKIHIQKFSNEAQMLQELAHGNLHYAPIDPLSKPMAQNLKDIKLLYSQDNIIYLVAINIDSYPLNIREFRQALSLSVDREIFEKAIEKGTQVRGPIPKFVVSDLPQSEYNPQQAQQLLKKCGYLDNPFPLTLLVENSPLSRMLAEFVVNSWREEEIKIKMELGQTNYVDRLVNREFQMAVAYYGSFIPHPEPYLWPYLSSHSPIPNVMRYKNEKIEKSYQEYVQTFDKHSEKQKLNEIVSLLLQDMPVIWLFSPPKIVATPANITFKSTPSSIPLFISFKLKN